MNRLQAFWLANFRFKGGNSNSIYMGIIKSESPMFKGTKAQTVNILL